MEQKIVYGFGFSDFIYFYQNNAEKLKDFLTLNKHNAQYYKKEYLQEIGLENASEITTTSLPKVLKETFEKEHNIKIEIIKEIEHEF